jgi:hypothetical protein
LQLLAFREFVGKRPGIGMLLPVFGSAAAPGSVSRFAIGYARGEAPLEFAEPIEERTVEYDQEALRHFREYQ